ncbi:YopX family protein [Cytobacillus purgationiresistens]|uniref:Phage protein (TIGR01671 family) n=1 Tax=Cytobacillus purgationiresistens TaxID=863449 RepID=A0ABU0ACC3_9BACI|nr:YopX family protein [Cytobacillus purgationiresistens]MDQ0268900.1 putative phage protein (TIGR01671 family) [Cytobacillus purgationiresistens]
MRERKIRGYAVEEMVGSQWVYGFGVYAVEFAEHYAKEIGRKRDWHLYTEDAGIVRVHEDSIGDYIGKKDKDGNEVHEGDIVTLFCQENKGAWNDFKVTGVVTYFEQFAQFLVKRENSHPQLGFDLFELCDHEDYELLEIEVIGNIYENPELINS